MTLAVERDVKPQLGLSLQNMPIFQHMEETKLAWIPSHGSIAKPKYNIQFPVQM